MGLAAGFGETEAHPGRAAREAKHHGGKGCADYGRTPCGPSDGRTHRQTADHRTVMSIWDTGLPPALPRARLLP